MTTHLDYITGRFVLSEHLVPAGNKQFYHVYDGCLILGETLVPKLGKGSGLPTVITYGITSPGGVFNLRSFGTVDYEVDWELTGSHEASTENTLPHTYAAGNHTLAVYSNSVYRPYFNNSTADASQVASVVIDSGADLGTNLQKAWYGATNITSFVCPFGATSGVTNFTDTWTNCSSLTSFPQIDTSLATTFGQAWRGCSGLTSFPQIDTSLITIFGQTWRGCTNLTSFPLIDTSSGVIYYATWRDCTNLTSFPLIDTSSGTAFNAIWQSCSSLTSFPLLDVSGGTTFNETWRGCTNLADFPANMFDTTGTLISGAFNSAWTSCALSAQSIENILVSLDTNGATGITLGISGGTNAAKTTWSAAAVTAYDNLVVKGWTIAFNA